MTQSPDDGITRWSTDAVDQADRFAYWREVLSANLIGNTAEAPPEDRDAFAGTVTRVPIADTGVMQLRMKFRTLRTSRTQHDIRKTPGDGIFLFRAISHPVDFYFPDRQGFVSIPGQTSIGGLDRERFAIPAQPGEYSVEVLRLPSASFRGVLDNPERLEPRLVAGSTGADNLLHGFFQSFMHELPRLDALERGSALGTLTNLAILALRGDRKAEEPQREAVRAARLQAARDYLARYAADPSLSPGHVAAALGMSTRQLHTLFEPTGTSLSRHLAGERVTQAVRALRYDTSRSVTDIAFACGFESLPTFYRTFRAITGMTPTELRAATMSR